MTGGSGYDDAQFKGWRKHFNTYTIHGRANIAMTTLGSMALIGLYFYLKPKKSAPKQP